MKSLTAYVTAALIALIIGIAFTWIYQINYPRFKSQSVWGGDGYVVHNFETPGSEEIILSHEFTSAEQTQYLFQSNLIAAKLIEQGSKLNEQGRKIGERAIIVFPYDGENEVARIFWTDGSDFWFIQAPSLSLAQEFENSEMFRSAMSSSFQPTAR